MRPLLATLALSLVALAAGPPARAQAGDAELPALARRMGLTLALPSLGHLRYDTTAATRLRQPTHLRWTQTADDLEVYVQLVPERPTGPPLMPHVVSGTALTDCARNSDDERDFIARYRPGDDDLARLGADWACFWAFRPKPGFSEREHGYQVSYYREGLGLVNLWVLADDRAAMQGAWPYVLSFAGPANSSSQDDNDEG